MAKTNGVRSVSRSGKAVLGAALAALACAWACMAGAPAAWALDAGVYTAELSASYASPDTGEIADAGGEGSQEIGTSMVEGIAGEHALIEADASGAMTATVRFGQADQLGDVSVACDPTHADAFGEGAIAEVVQLDEEQNTADYRFVLPTEDATIRFDMFVEPMGRNVTFFGRLGNAVAGNTDGFIETADTAAPAQDAAEDAAPDPAEPAATADAAAAYDDAAASDGDTQSGVREFTGDGAEATGAQDGADAAAGLNYPLIIGVIVLIIAVVVLIVFFAVVRPKKARQQQAAEAAAGRGRFEGRD